MNKSRLAAAVFFLPFMVMAENILKNADFSQLNTDGKPVFWSISQGTAMVEKGGKDFPAVLTLASSAVQKNYKAGFYQILPGMVRGEYILSGYFSGSMTALWIVMNAGTKPFRLWLNKNKFEKSEKEGWYRFTVKICVNVPPENGKGLLAIETFTSSAGQKTSFAEIRLDSQRD